MVWNKWYESKQYKQALPPLYTYFTCPKLMHGVGAKYEAKGLLHFPLQRLLLSEQSRRRNCFVQRDHLKWWKPKSLDEDIYICMCISYLLYYKYFFKLFLLGGLFSLILRCWKAHSVSYPCINFVLFNRPFAMFFRFSVYTTAPSPGLLQQENCPWPVSFRLQVLLWMSTAVSWEAKSNFCASKLSPTKLKSSRVPK